MHTLIVVFLIPLPQFLMPSGAIRLGQLLSSAYSYATSHWQAVVYGAVIFGTVSALLLGSVQHKAGTGFGMMMQDMGMDVEKMEELGARMQAGDESAMVEMEELIDARFGDMTDAEQGAMGRMMGLNALRYAAPYVGLSFLIALILMVASAAYFLVLGLGQAKDAGTIAGRIAPLFFPLLGVWIWSFLRSFAWIPVLGLIPAVILGPRFALAPVILVQEKKGVVDSVRESYSRTTGYWGKIVGNFIVAGLCVWVASVVVMMVAGIAGAASPWLALWITSVAKYVFMGYMTIFGVQLALTIIANPIGPVQKAPAKKK